MDAETRKNVATRLKKIEGQVAGLARMVDDDRYCIDVMRQVSSVQQALHGVARVIMESHLRHCVREAMRSDDPTIEERTVQEILDTVYTIRKA